MCSYGDEEAGPLKGSLNQYLGNNKAPRNLPAVVPNDPVQSHCASCQVKSILGCCLQCGNELLHVADFLILTLRGTVGWPQPQATAKETPGECASEDPS